MSSNVSVLEKDIPQTYAVARKSDPNYIKGRRDFFEYIDLGVIDASNGALRVQVTKASEGMSEPTGWHFHTCEGQFVYMVKGWVELQFAPDDIIRLDEGDSVYIPGGLPHNEIRTSDDFELLELSLPAEMGTEACAPPA